MMDWNESSIFFGRKMHSTPDGRRWRHAAIRIMSGERKPDALPDMS
jgi:hypothetical protein